jgi:hypothetical protein
MSDNDEDLSDAMADEQDDDADAAVTLLGGVLTVAEVAAAVHAEGTAADAAATAAAAAIQAELQAASAAAMEHIEDEADAFFDGAHAKEILDQQLLQEVMNCGLLRQPKKSRGEMWKKVILPQL